MEKIRGRRRLKITRRLELHFWPTRKRSQPSQGDFFPLQREPWSKAHHHSMRVRLMVLNATFYNISVKSWQSFVLVEETRLLGENHWPVASHWHHKMLYRVYLVWAGFELTDCTGSYKFNYHTITITTAPIQWGTGGLTERCARFVTTERLAGNNWCPVVYSLNPTYSRLSSLSLDGKGHDIESFACDL